MSGPLGDSLGELCRIRRLFDQTLVVLLFVVCPVLVLLSAQLEELLLGAPEIDLVLLSADDLGEISMRISRLDGVTFEFAGDKSGGASDGGGLESGEVAPEAALRIFVEQAEALKDLVE